MEEEVAVAVQACLAALTQLLNTYTLPTAVSMECSEGQQYSVLARVQAGYQCLPGCLLHLQEDSPQQPLHATLHTAGHAHLPF